MAERPADPRKPVTLQQLAHGARMAIRDGVDPLLALSYIIWPPTHLKVARGRHARAVRKAA